MVVLLGNADSNGRLLGQQMRADVHVMVSSSAHHTTTHDRNLIPTSDQTLYLSNNDSSLQQPPSNNYPGVDNFGAVLPAPPVSEAANVHSLIYSYFLKHTWWLVNLKAMQYWRQLHAKKQHLLNATEPTMRARERKDFEDLRRRFFESRKVGALNFNFFLNHKYRYYYQFSG